MPIAAHCRSINYTDYIHHCGLLVSQNVCDETDCPEIFGTNIFMNKTGLRPGPRNLSINIFLSAKKNREKLEQNRKNLEENRNIVEVTKCL